MNASDQDRRMRAANPVPVPDAIGDSADLDRLRERAAALASADEAKPRRRRLGSRVLIPAGVTSVALITGALFLLSAGTGGTGGTSPAFAAAAVAVAEANPRLLVGEPGWEVIRADAFEPDRGEIEFSNGDSELQITWYPAQYYEGYRRDRAANPGPDIPIEVLGQDGTMIQYGQTTDFATMLPPAGAIFIEIRGNLGSEEAYRGILSSLEQVDVETWLSAMPESVVKPVDRGAVVDSMLEGVPVPPGFELEELRASGSVSDRYQLGARVTGAVSCEWVERYVAAEKLGDAATAEASLEAMNTSRSWPILQEMMHQGGWSQAVWMISDQLNKGELNTGVGSVSTYPGGKVIEYGPAYASALGCDEYRRVVSEGGK